MPLGCHLVPKGLQSDPKGFQNGALGGHLGDFFCKKPTLHPTAYLLCFRHILGVLGSPVLQKFLLEMCVGSRPPKKAVTLSLFLIFKRKCVKMGAQMEGEISRKNRPFSHWSTFGCPWVHFLGLLGSLGIILRLFWCSGHHFATLGPHQNEWKPCPTTMQHLHPNMCSNMKQQHKVKEDEYRVRIGGTGRRPFQ